MIRFERKETEKAQKAISSLENEKRKGGGTYNTPEVNAALYEMFHGKCYLCESKEVASCQIEHLVPHRGDENLKFAWNNLLYSCTHCNNIKNDRFTPILDCTAVDVDQKIAFRKKGYFGVEETLEFEVLEDSVEAQNTVRLLHAIHYGTTPQKKMEAKVIRKHIRKELSNFKELIREYCEEEGEDKQDLLAQIKKELKPNSAFTAFKRWIVRDHQELPLELRDLIPR